MRLYAIVINNEIKDFPVKQSTILAKGIPVENILYVDCYDYPKSSLDYTYKPNAIINNDLLNVTWDKIKTTLSSASLNYLSIDKEDENKEYYLNILKCVYKRDIIEIFSEKIKQEKGFKDFDTLITYRTSLNVRYNLVASTAFSVYETIVKELEHLLSGDADKIIEQDIINLFDKHKSLITDF